MLLTFFPRIPEGACLEILEHGFQKGSGRVGRSGTLEDKLKVQLAVNAHIRHRLTQYDSILAVNKGQDAKLAAREKVHDQVQAIADSWRATSSQALGAKSRMPVPKDSAATLKANRQRRTRTRKAKTSAADEAQVLEEALGGLRLSENEREAVARTEAAERRAQKKARKVARKTRSEIKQKKKKVLRLQGEQKEGFETGKYLQKVYERQHPNLVHSRRREGNRKQRITTHGVELVPKELDRYVPTYGSSNDEPRKPRLLRSNYPIFDNTPTEIDTRDDGVQLVPRGCDRYVPTSDLNMSIDPPRKSRYPLRSSHRTSRDLETNNKGLDSTAESTSDEKLMVEDPEWMDIDGISLRTAGVQLT